MRKITPLVRGEDALLFFDLDGILVDFVGGMLLEHGIERADQENFIRRAQINGDWKKLYVALGMSATKFWSKSRDNVDYWKSLEPTKEAFELIALAELSVALPLKQIYFLSSPSIDSRSYSGKKEWLDIHFPRYSQNLILARDKFLIASHGRFLIDDNDKKVESFIRAGGKGFLYPRIWNSGHLVEDRGLSMFKDFLKKNII